MTEFWGRRQGPDEKTCRYIEDKARIARQMRAQDEQFVVQGTIQGMRADVRRDVLIQRPTTIEALRTAADIADASTRAGGGGQSHAQRRAAMTAHFHISGLRAMFAGMQAMMTNGRQHRRPSPIDNHY